MAASATFVATSGVALAARPAPSWPPPPDPDDAAPATAQPLPPLPPPADDDDEPQPAPAARPAPVPEAHCEDRGDAASSEEATPAKPPVTWPDPWETNPFSLELQFGLGSPLGLAGLALDYAVSPAVSLNAGVGVAASGFQGAVSMRVRLVRFGHRAHFAPFVGGGFSMGAHDQGMDIFSQNAGLHWSTAYWGNLEAGMELRFSPHFELRPATGVAILLNQGAGVEDVQNTPVAVDAWMFYAGLTLGFGL